MLHGERACAVADEQDVGRPFHDAACDRRGVADVFKAADRAARQRVAVHDAGIERNRADRVGDAAKTDGIDLRIILDGLGPSDGGIQSGTPVAEHRKRNIHGDAAKRPSGDYDGFWHEQLLGELGNW